MDWPDLPVVKVRDHTTGTLTSTTKLGIKALITFALSEVKPLLMETSSTRKKSLQPDENTFFLSLCLDLTGDQSLFCFSPRLRNQLVSLRLQDGVLSEEKCRSLNKLSSLCQYLANLLHVQ